MEIFKDIKGFSNYEISNHGNIRIKKTGRIRRASINNGKYRRLGLTKNGIAQNFFVHRLVAEHFIPNPNDLPQVNHIDGIKTNNNVKNLEWVSNSQNMNHAYGLGLSDQGEKHYHAVLTNSQAKQIFDMAWSGHRPKDIAEKFGVLPTSICNIKYKRSWKHIHKKGSL